MADKRFYGFELPKWNTEGRRTRRPAPSSSTRAHVESQLTKDELEVLEVLESMAMLAIDPLVDVEIKGAEEETKMVEKGKEKVVNETAVEDDVKNKGSLIFRIPIKKTVEGESSGKGKNVVKSVERKDGKEAEKVASGPWNLRSRANKSLLNANVGGYADNVTNTMTRVHLDFLLTPREIQEDLVAMGIKPTSRRIKRRPKILQNKLDGMFPGTSLTNITAETYKVAEPKKKYG